MKNISGSKPSFHNFLSCFDIQDSDLKRCSTHRSIKKSHTERPMLNIIQNVSGFEDKLEEDSEKNKLSKPVEDIISKIAKFKQEHYESKSKINQTSKYLNFLTKNYKKIGFKSSLSPMRKKIKRIKYEKIDLREGKNSSGRNSRIKSKKSKKKSENGGNKSFDPFKRVRTVKNLGNKKRSKSPKSILQKLTE